MKGEYLQEMALPQLKKNKNKKVLFCENTDVFLFILKFLSNTPFHA